MYTLCKVKGRSHWQVRYKDGKKRVLRSAGTDDKKLAEEYAQKLAADHWRVRKLGDKPRKLWMTAAVEYVQEKPRIRFYLRFLDEHLRDLYLDEITQDLVSSIRQAKKATGVTGTMVNRTMEVVRAVMNREAKNGYRVPKLYFERYKEPGRMAFLTREEADRLINELPPHLAAMVKFALSTGLRESNITGLQWSQVDLERRIAWIPKHLSKSGKPIKVPLNNDAMVVLRECQGRHKKWVFVYDAPRGRMVDGEWSRYPDPDRVTRISGMAWRKALKRCGLNIRVHDLRHTWASWHVQSGTPLVVLKELGGWSDIKTVMRYAHLGDSHIAEWAGNVSGPRVVTKVATVDEPTVAQHSATS